MPNTCHQPPGRIYAVTNFLPVIPRPQWERYVATGRFPAGIQAGLDETSSCAWVDDMAQVRAQSVVVDDQVISANIRGAFPWGWYKFPWAPSPGVPVPPPPPPSEAARFVAAIARVGSRAEGMQLDPIMGGTSACQISDVPTIDVLCPYPLNDGAARFREGQRYLRAGDLGRFVVRVPGSQHPMFSTGYGIAFITKRYLSAIGLELFDFWDRIRMTTGAMLPAGTPADRRYEEISWTMPIFSTLDRANMVPVAWYTRDFSDTHMQCLARNCYPQTDALRGLGLAGKPIADWRWQAGGTKSAAYVGSGWDAYGEAATAVVARAADNTLRSILSDAMNYAWPTGLDPDGNPWSESAPEAPLGYKNRWDGRQRLEGAWSGPAPGSLQA